MNIVEIEDGYSAEGTQLWMKLAAAGKWRRRAHRQGGRTDESPSSSSSSTDDLFSFSPIPSFTPKPCVSVFFAHQRGRMAFTLPACSPSRLWWHLKIFFSLFFSLAVCVEERSAFFGFELVLAWWFPYWSHRILCPPTSKTQFASCGGRWEGQTELAHNLYFSPNAPRGIKVQVTQSSKGRKMTHSSL